MDIPEEAERRYPKTDYYYDAAKREAFIAGAEWARKQTLEEAAKVADDIADSEWSVGAAIAGRHVAEAVRALGEVH